MGTEVNSDTVNPMNKKRQKIEENLKNALRQLSQESENKENDSKVANKWKFRLQFRPN